VKQRHSFLEKIGRKGYQTPFQDMRDLVGARVVCLFLDDLSVVDEIIRRTFKVVGYEDKTQGSRSEVFGYQAVHYDCEIFENQHGRYYDPIKNIVFEIQVKTILQDAWASVEHYLGYKGQASVPSASKRDFGALVGLFHLADKTFQQIKHASTSSEIAAEAALQSFEASEAGQDKDADLALDRASVKALLRQLFPDRKPSSDFAYSDFVDELTKFGLSGVGELKNDLQSGLAAAEAAESQDPPPGIGNESARYMDVGIARIAMDIARPQFRHLRFQLRQRDS
jgi:ppGpp synthetase/RelA/SpoT-type nucleotidyltranferase